MSTRGGFTLVELIVGTVVMAILGTILARMLVQDSRFVSQLEAMMDARQSARAAMNSMAVELRMISSGGLVNASPTTIEVRSPFGWGVACDRDVGDTIASLVPADSMWYASAVSNVDGIAWLDGAGSYQFEPGVSVTSSGNSAACTAEGVSILPGGQLVAVNMVNVPAPGTVIYLFQEVTYSFAESSVLPGRIGLWRQAGSAPNEEVLAPFDSTAGFGFFVDPSAAPLVNPPADLSTVTGLELRLHGESAITPEGRTEFEDFQLQTRVTFLNAAN